MVISTSLVSLWIDVHLHLLESERFQANVGNDHRFQLVTIFPMAFSLQTPMNTFPMLLGTLVLFDFSLMLLVEASHMGCRCWRLVVIALYERITLWLNM